MPVPALSALSSTDETGLRAAETFTPVNQRTVQLPVRAQRKRKVVGECAGAISCSNVIFVKSSA